MDREEIKKRYENLQLASRQLSPIVQPFSAQDLASLERGTSLKISRLLSLKVGDNSTPEDLVSLSELLESNPIFDKKIYLLGQGVTTNLISGPDYNNPSIVVKLASEIKALVQQAPFSEDQYHTAIGPIPRQLQHYLSEWTENTRLIEHQISKQNQGHKMDDKPDWSLSLEADPPGSLDAAIGDSPSLNLEDQKGEAVLVLEDLVPQGDMNLEEQAKLKTNLALQYEEMISTRPMIREDALDFSDESSFRPEVTLDAADTSSKGAIPKNKESKKGFLTSLIDKGKDFGLLGNEKSKKDLMGHYKLSSGMIRDTDTLSQVCEYILKFPPELDTKRIMIILAGLASTNQDNYDSLEGMIERVNFMEGKIESIANMIPALMDKIDKMQNSMDSFAKVIATAQRMDEARHKEIMDQLLKTKITTDQPKMPNIQLQRDAAIGPVERPLEPRQSGSSSFLEQVNLAKKMRSKKGLGVPSVATSSSAMVPTYTPEKSALRKLAESQLTGIQLIDQKKEEASRVRIPTDWKTKYTNMVGWDDETNPKRNIDTNKVLYILGKLRNFSGSISETNHHMITDYFNQLVQENRNWFDIYYTVGDIWDYDELRKFLTILSQF